MRAPVTTAPVTPFRPQPLVDGVRVLITGGAGFVGSHLADALIARGCRVSVIDNLSTGRFENIRHLVPDAHFRFAIDSVTNDSVLDHLVGDCDAIFHLASAVGVELIVSDPVHALESNIMGTRAVLTAANRYKKPLLMTSTSEVYGKSERVPFAEDDDRVLGPTSKARWSYATSKAVSEHLCLAYHQKNELPVVVARLFNTVGPRQRGRYGMVIPRFVAQALAGERLKIFGDGEQQRCFCYVTDVVEGLIGLMEHPGAIGRVFNVGSTREISIRALAIAVLEAVDRYHGTSRDDLEAQLSFVGYDQAYGPGFEDMRRRLPDIRRIGDLTGWGPTTSLEDTLTKVIADRSGGSVARPSRGGPAPQKPTTVARADSDR